MLVRSLEFFDKDVDEAHDFLTKDLDLPWLVDVFVGVEDDRELGGNRPFQFVIRKHFVSDSELFGGWGVVLIAIPQEALAVLFGLFLNLLDVFLDHFSEGCILPVLCCLFIQSALLSDRF